mmetsp:Transcript_28438/g.52362  ORF Transcript_28438/g.52362 Transcript_28438/m.52362 type:complete len:315 (-) Transcript_28438:1114-2058(-)
MPFIVHVRRQTRHHGGAASGTQSCKSGWVPSGLLNQLLFLSVERGKGHDGSTQGIDVTERDGLRDLEQGFVSIAMRHDDMSTRQPLHNKVERIDGRDFVRLTRQLTAITEDGLEIPTQLSLSQSVLLNTTALLDGHAHSPRPATRFRSDGECRDGTALPGRVADVKTDGLERRVRLDIASVDPELEDGENDAEHQKDTQVAHTRHGLDGQLAEQGEHELLEKGVAKHTDGHLRRDGGGGSQRPISKQMLHWRTDAVLRLERWSGHITLSCIGGGVLSSRSCSTTVCPSSHKRREERRRLTSSLRTLRNPRGGHI